MRPLIGSLCVFQDARFVNGLGVHLQAFMSMNSLGGVLGCEVSGQFLCLFPSM